MNCFLKLKENENDMKKKEEEEKKYVWDINKFNM